MLSAGGLEVALGAHFGAMEGAWVAIWGVWGMSWSHFGSQGVTGSAFVEVLILILEYFRVLLGTLLEA